MRKNDFEELATRIRQAGRICRGTARPTRVTRHRCPDGTDGADGVGRTNSPGGDPP